MRAASALETARRVRAGEIPADRPLEEALARAREADAGPRGIHAFLSLSDSGANSHPEPASGPPPNSDSRDAREPGSAADDGDPDLTLAGVPVAVKDNLCTLELPTTCASRFLEGYRSPYEATVVRRLRARGGRVVGKTNLDEFGMGSSTENSAFGPTRNPRDPSRVPGGSSGGSAAAVAAGVVPCALGSDTGGSVRQPAALCGVVGVKPTYGRVSRYGLVAFASSLDQVGTFGASVADAALLLEAISGHDPRDSTSAPLPAPDLMGHLDDGVAGKVVGIPVEYVPDSLDPEIRARMDEASRHLAEAGAEIRRVSLPHTRYAVPTYYVLATAEASSNLARYDGVRFGVRSPEARATQEVYEASRTRGFGPEVVRRIILGTFGLSAGYHDQYYGRAQRVRALIARDFRRVWADGVDVLLTPTSPTPAFPLGERSDDPVSMYLSDIFTVTANLAGIPAVSVPAGTTHGLPCGAQLLAPAWHEAPLLAAARTLEQSLGGGA
ncbi:MAG: Asp-tRNA(Asn)/Glu-tRNA(Gln) amidotransferase subunit GatA [Gemmatimonadales bacterium]|nr:MAG: Asp-tRNA(Asn)/Glu-tRNA(Gln) amidotransferase subunit GatA [Gemmatimonadales bacterium]